MRAWCRCLAGVVFAVVMAVLAGAPATSQTPARPPAKVRPRPEAVAETRLLMEALAQPNFRGLEQLLRQKPDSAEAWKFARGQALLLAELGNLLLLRPPRSAAAQQRWFERAVELRRAAREVAENAARSDYERTRTAFVSLANVCNRCHRTFRIAVDIVPFDQPAPKTPG
jgi:hypothetical protein